MNSIVIGLSNKAAALNATTGHAPRAGFIIAVMLIFLLTGLAMLEALADQRISRWVHDFNYAIVPLLIILGILVVIQLAQLLHIL